MIGGIAVALSLPQAEKMVE